MGNGKIWPPPRLNPLTDRHQNLHRWLHWWYLPPYKILSRSDKRFLHMRNFAHQIVYSANFWWGFYVSPTAKTLPEMLMQNTSEIILLKDSMYTAYHWKSEQQTTWQDTACSLCRGDVHSSSEVGSSAAGDIANTGISHSYDHQVWQLGSLTVLLSFLHTSDIPLWQNISRNNSEMNNISHPNSITGH